MQRSWFVCHRFETPIVAVAAVRSVSAVAPLTSSVIGTVRAMECACVGQRELMVVDCSEHSGFLDR